jgi:PmbA protein
LALPRDAAAALADTLSFEDGHVELFRQPQSLELHHLELDQRFPEPLGGVCGAFTRALAGAQLQTGIVILFCGWGSHFFTAKPADHGCYNSAMQAPHDVAPVANLEKVVGLALEEAKRRGASQSEVDASMNRGLTATVRLGEVDTVEYQRDRGLDVTVYFGKRKGSASTADLSVQAVRDTVEKASTIARYTAEDEHAGLADPKELARDIPDLDLEHPWELPPERAVELARACESAGLAVDQRLTNSEGATVSSQRDVRVYGNSHGFLAGYGSTSHTVSCVLLAQVGEDMQRDYWFTTARDPADLESIEAIGRKAGERALARLNARKLSTRRAPVIFAAEIARGLLGHCIGAIRGTAQYRKSSFLLDAAGQQIFPEFLGIQERPHIRKGLASAPFDNEGVATRDRDLITRGVLQGYLLGSYSARKLGLKTTGNAGGNHNLVVSSPGHALAFDALLRQMGSGLLVTELMGQGVNPVTGDYSRGASGFWVENGAIAYPIHEITIAGNLRDMYRRIVALGSDVDLRGGIRTGSILIDEMTVAGE